MFPVLLAAVLTTGFAGAALAQPAPVSTEIIGQDQVRIGEVTLTAAPDGVLVRIEAQGLTPGWHGAHFHEKADCSDAAFENSGGHVHGASSPVHGLLNPDATDVGDLPNIHADADGKVTVELYSTLVVLEEGKGDRPALRDADGSALVIHASPDDHMSQPIGGAGDRVACATIR